METASLRSSTPTHCSSASASRSPRTPVATRTSRSAGTAAPAWKAACFRMRKGDNVKLSGNPDRLRGGRQGPRTFGVQGHERRVLKGYRFRRSLASDPAFLSAPRGTFRRRGRYEGKKSSVAETPLFHREAADYLLWNYMDYL